MLAMSRRSRIRRLIRLADRSISSMGCLDRRSGSEPRRRRTDACSRICQWIAKVMGHDAHHPVPRPAGLLSGAIESPALNRHRGALSQRLGDAQIVHHIRSRRGRSHQGDDTPQLFVCQQWNGKDRADLHRLERSPVQFVLRPGGDHLRCHSVDEDWLLRVKRGPGQMRARRIGRHFASGRRRSTPSMDRPTAFSQRLSPSSSTRSTTT